MSDCRFGVSAVNYPNPDPDHQHPFNTRITIADVTNAENGKAAGIDDIQAESIRRLFDNVSDSAFQ